MNRNRHRIPFDSRATLLVIVLVYWFSRLANLALLPVFVDEAIMVRDAQSLSTRPVPVEQLSRNSKWFHVWLFHLILPLASGNALWFSRFLSVIAGLLACLGCYRLGEQIFDRSLGLLSAVLFLLSWSTTLKLLTDRSSTGLDSVLCGLFMGLATLTKAVNAMVLSIPIVCLFANWERRHSKQVQGQVALAYLLAFLLSLPMLGNLPQQFVMMERHTVVSASLGGVVKLWSGNLQDTVVWLSSYWGWSGFLFLLAGVLYAVIFPKREMVVLMISIVGPLLILIAVSKNWFPRYFMPIAGSSCIMIAWVIMRCVRFLQNLHRARAFHLWARRGMAVLFAALLGIMCWQSIHFDWLIVMNPPQAPFPAVDLYQYVQGWPSGYGVLEASEFLLRETNENPGGNIQVIRHYVLDPLDLLLNN